MTIGKSMLLISSMRDGAPTFRMMPLGDECPYIEVVYVPQAKAAVVFSKHAVEGLHMVPQLDSNGDMVRAPKPRQDGNPYKQERRLMTTSHEYYITNKQEIIEFVEMFAANTDKFDYKKFMVEPVAKQESPIIMPETPKIITP